MRGCGEIVVRKKVWELTQIRKDYGTIGSIEDPYRAVCHTMDGILSSPPSLLPAGLSQSNQRGILYDIAVSQQRERERVCMWKRILIPSGGERQREGLLYLSAKVCLHETKHIQVSAGDFVCACKWADAAAYVGHLGVLHFSSRVFRWKSFSMNKGDGRRRTSVFGGRNEVSLSWCSCTRNSKNDDTWFY